MKNIFTFILIICSLITSTVYADVICPFQITCNYDTGLCDTSGSGSPGAGYWSLYTGGAQEPFLGSKDMNLSAIYAHRPGSSPSDLYTLDCEYTYGEYSWVLINTYVKTLSGPDWNYSDMGKYNAYCSNISDPAACKGHES